MSNNNKQLIIILDELSNIMSKQGEPFKAKAYNSAKDAITQYPQKITATIQLKDVSNIGKSCLQIIDEFLKTGKVQILEKERNNPIHIFADIYGVGPKKAKEIVEEHKITTIQQLREKQTHILNATQQIGLKYYEDILQRIPRQEIDHFFRIFEKVAHTQSGLTFDIAGSYRRKAADSGDIDVILTAPNESSYTAFIELLIKTRVIVEVLSRGKSKCLVIARIPTANPDKVNVARRIDFLFCSKEEYPFSLLYFTGSKLFNTNSRAHAQKMGYTMNEHGITHVSPKQSSLPIPAFHSEKDIFTFLNLEFVEPEERNVGELIYIKKELKENPLTKYKQLGIPFLHTLSEQELNALIVCANQEYHGQVDININTKITLSDNEFDILKEFYEQKFNKKQMDVGASVSGNSSKGAKSLLPYEMWSMDKIKADSGALEEWKKQYKNPKFYVLSCKLDGVSGLFCFPNKLYTRGNGKVGQDISHLVPYINGLHNLSPMSSGVAIRGEFIIKKQIFESKYKTEFANARNLVAGIINSNSPDKDKMADICFVAYELIGTPLSLSPSEQMMQLKQMNIPTVYSLNASTEMLTNEFMSKLLVKVRNEYLFETDGLICAHDKAYPRVSSNPKHAFAFKMMLSEQMAEAKVLDVIWTASKDGYMKPRVQIEPVILGGVKIEFATGFNAGFIKQNCIGLGAQVQIIRSGDVIPHIQKVTVPAPGGPKMPYAATASAADSNNTNAEYTWSESGVDIILKDVSSNSDVREKTMTGFFKKLEVDGLGQGNIAKLIAAGQDSVPKICKMGKHDFLQVDGFKEKMAEKLYSGIQSQLATASLPKLMVASNIFGRGFSDTKISSILEINPELSQLIMMPKQPHQQKQHQQQVQTLKEVKGISEKSLQEFMQHIPEFIQFMKDCGLSNEIKMVQIVQAKESKESNHNTSHPFYNKTIVVTGTRDKNLLEHIVKMGGKLGQTVTKKTDFVIAKDIAENSSKIEDAKRLGIPVLSADQIQVGQYK